MSVSRPSPRLPLLAPALLAFAVAAVGCAQKDPQERVAELRRQYSAEVNSFSVQQTPLEEEMIGDPASEAEAASEAGAEEAVADDGEEMAPEPVPTRTDVLLDILVQNRAVEPLPGVTLDISHADAQGTEKGHWRVWVDTTQLLKGRGQSFVHRLEDIDYVVGDGFHVEIRPVPVAERGEYQEFTSAGEGG